jgi:hypothetical protein
MKTLSIAILVGLLAFSGCKKDEVTPQPTAAQKTTALLTSGTGKWTPSSTAGVTVDGLDVTADLFKDFSITFTDNKIFTTGTTPVWLREDSWTFKNDEATIMARGQDNKEIHIEEITDDQLQISLEWDQTTYAEGGKVKSIPGTFVFTLSK